MPNNTNTTNNNFSTDQNVSDKHLNFFNQRNPAVLPNTPPPQPAPQTQQVQNQSFGNPAQQVPQRPQNQLPQQPLQSNTVQQPRPYFPNQNTLQNQQVRPRAVAPTQPLQPVQKPVPPQPIPTQQQSNIQVKYLNPNNIAQTQPPKDLDDVRLRAVQANKPLPTQPTNLVAQHYDPLVPQAKQVVINTFELLKLCLYIIPGLPIFLLIFKSVKDEEVMWNTRQSLVMQVLWLVVYFILENINFPLISGSGITLANIWNLFCIGVLVYAGAQAYLGKHYKIPLLHDIAMTYIDGK